MEKIKLPTAATLLKSVGKHNIAFLIDWIDANRKWYEEIEVYQWTGPLWYITVKDTQSPEKYPGNLPIGFSVDLDEDRIFWANDRTKAGYGNGGNVFCRSERWFRRLRKQYTAAVSDYGNKGVGSVHDYRPRRGVPKFATE